MAEPRTLTEEELTELEGIRVADALALLRLVPAGRFQQGCVVSNGDLLRDRARALRHLPHALAELRQLREYLVTVPEGIRALSKRAVRAEAERDELKADAKAWKYANRAECLACGVLAVTINPPHPDAPTASCGSCGMAYQLAALDGAVTDA